jgi:anti-sigma B factor antagonist
VTPLARIDVSRAGNVVIVHVAGDVDLSNSAELRHALTDAATPDTTGLAVDMSDVGYVDSTGLTVLAELARELGVRRQGLAVVAPARSGIRRLLELVQLDRVITLRESVDQATAALESAD